MSLWEGMVTGFCTGIALFIANWASKKYLENRLDRTHDRISGLANKIRKLARFKYEREPIQAKKGAEELLQEVKGRDDKLGEDSEKVSTFTC
jgi:hypothetical protein